MRILGIDLGTTTIKAVELDSAFGRYEIHEYHEQKIEAGLEPAQALARLLQSLAKQPDRIATVLRTGHVTLRTLTLPTKEKKAIQAAVGFELDDDLPFSLDQAVYDYSILSQSKAGTQVHVAATLKRHLGAFLDLWRSSGIDPDLITTEAWAYRTLLNRILPPQQREQPVLVAQIGHERTILYVHLQNAPVLSREIAWGGRDLSQAIAQKYNIPADQAEQAKLDHGFVIPESQMDDATQEQVDFSNTLLEPIKNLIWNIRQAELTCRNITHFNLSAVYLAGGGSLLPGLSRVIEEGLQLPVRPLQALSTLTSSGVTYSEHTDANFVQAVASALCLVGNERSIAINFRKGQFAKQGHGREINISTLRRPLLALGAIGACLVLSLLVTGSVYRSRLKDTDVELERAVKSFFGQVSASGLRSYLSNPASLRTKINAELNKQKELSRIVGPNPRSPIDFLRELSTSIPKSQDLAVDITQFQVGAAPTAPPEDANASLTFLMPKPESADRLSSILSSKLTGMQKTRPEQVPGIGENATPKWKVTFTGKPTEDAYGK